MRSRCAQGDQVVVDFPKPWFTNPYPMTKAVQETDPAKPHYLSVGVSSGSEGALHFSSSLRSASGKVERFRRLLVMSLTRDLEAGEHLWVALRNTSAPEVSGADEVRVYVRRTGDEVWQQPAKGAGYRVLAGAPRVALLFAPSQSVVGMPLELQLTLLDRYNNPVEALSGSANAVAEVRYILDSDRGSAPPAQTVAVRSATTRFVLQPGEEGFLSFEATVDLGNSAAVLETFAGPTRIVAANSDALPIYWGDLHSHSDISKDAVGKSDWSYARDITRLDFFASTEHDTADPFLVAEPDALGGLGISEPEWEAIRNNVESFYQPGSFVTLLAYEGNLASGGHHNVFFRDPSDWPRPPRYDDPSELFQQLVLGEAIAIPHHLGINWGRDRSPVNSPELRPVTDPTHTFPGPWLDWNARPRGEGKRPALEIYSGHGQSEFFDASDPLAYESVRFTPAVSQDGPHYARDAWVAGQMLGTIAASDNHQGQPGLSHYGLTAVRAPRLTRDAIFDGIRNRSTYASTGQRLYVEFEVEGQSMGEVVSLARDASAIEGRFLVAAPRPIRFVEVWYAPVVGRAGDAGAGASDWKRFEHRAETRVSAETLSLSLDSLLGVGAQRTLRDGPELVLYLRAVLTSDHPQGLPGARPVRVWTSPIWVDLR